MMTTRQANSAILDGIAGELAVAFDNTSSTIALTYNKLSKSRTKKSRGKTDARPVVSTTESDTAESSETRPDHDAVSRKEFTVLQISVQTLAERMNGFLDRMEEAEDGPRSDQEDAARVTREEEPATEADADPLSLRPTIPRPTLTRPILQRPTWTR